MAITETRNLPAPFIQSLGEYYGKELPALTKDKMDVSQWAPTVAGQDPLQQQAATLAGQTGKGIGAFEQYLTAGEDYAGPDAYKQFMSPYQQQVIDTSLDEFDRQSQMRQQQLRDQTLLGVPGAFGGGREGVQLGEYQAGSDRNRLALQAQMLQQGYGNAQNARQQAFTNQQAIASGQLGLGTAQQQMGQQQLGLGAAQMGLSNFQRTGMGGDIGALGQLGSLSQAQTQANLTAYRTLIWGLGHECDYWVTFGEHQRADLK